MTKEVNTTGITVFLSIVFACLSGCGLSGEPSKQDKPLSQVSKEQAAEGHSVADNNSDGKRNGRKDVDSSLEKEGDGTEEEKKGSMAESDLERTFFLASNEAVNGNWDKAREFIQKTGKVNFVDLSGGLHGTFLHTAVHNNDLDVARELISLGANVNLRNAVDLTPLILAAKKNEHEMVVLLVENGADVEATCSWRYSGPARHTPKIPADHRKDALEYAKKNRNGRMIRYLKDRIKDRTQRGH